jgi:hypothetical protein
MVAIDPFRKDAYFSGIELSLSSLWRFEKRLGTRGFKAK